MVLYSKAVLAGLCFGAWPLFMNRSGLSGYLSCLVITVIILLCTLPFAVRDIIGIFSVNWVLAFIFILLFCIIPFAMRDIDEIFSANWVMWLSAGILGSIGMLLFTNILATATGNIGIYLAIVALAQVSVPAAYHMYKNGEIVLTKVFGFIFAGIAAVLLSL